MIRGICICGLNGSGKTTLAASLARSLNFKHMDIEDYYFLPSDIPYSRPRTKEEVIPLVLKDMNENPCFVFSYVKGDMTPEINAKFDLVVYLDVPKNIRMERIKKRAYDKFGDRVLIGGDMYEQEEAFFKMASSREPSAIKSWLDTLPCKVLCLDGTKEINDILEIILKEIK